MSIRSVLYSAIAAAIMLCPATSDLVVDGDLSDWGVTVADNKPSTYLVPSGLTGAYGVEDSDDLAGDGGTLGPNPGGQNYDAEFLGVALQDDRLLISIVTGQRPENGFARYAPGDVQFTTRAGIFGVEMRRATR